jgi:uncharacterized protein YjbJ (UPF0337 family)
MSERETYEQAGDWLIGTVKRNPEALLVLAAGCALLMRSKSSGEASPRHEGQTYRAAEYRAGEPSWQQERRSSGAMDGAAESARGYASDVGGRVRDSAGRATDSASQYASDVTNRFGDTANRMSDTAGQYASDVAGRVSETANTYASTVSDYAGGVRDTVVSGAGQARSTVQRGFARVLREQPLAIAAMGLAAGATLAAIFPASETESQVLGPAHDAVVDAASRAAANVKDAAGEAGEQLKQAARERGLDPEGLKGLAREVAGNFADNVTGRSSESKDQAQTEAPGLVPESTGAGS